MLHTVGRVAELSCIWGYCMYNWGVAELWVFYPWGIEQLGFCTSGCSTIGILRYWDVAQLEVFKNWGLAQLGCCTIGGVSRNGCIAHWGVIQNRECCTIGVFHNCSIGVLYHSGVAQ